MATLFTDLLPPNYQEQYFWGPGSSCNKWTHTMKLTLMAKKFPEIMDIIKIIATNISGEINDKNYDYMTALMIACINCRILSSIECVQLLINLGADVNCIDRFEYDSLYLAQEYVDTSSSIECMKILVNSGARFDKLYNCQNLLIHASRQAKIECVKLLVNFGLDINGKDWIEGCTSLMYASAYADRYNSVQCVKLLIDLGAKINKKNFYGKSALIIAIESLHRGSNMECIKLLIENGANVNEKNNHGDLFNAFVDKDRTVLMYLFSSGIIFNESDIDDIMMLIHKSKKTICDLDCEGKSAYDHYVDNKYNILSVEQLEYLKGVKVLGQNLPVIRHN